MYLLQAAEFNKKQNHRIDPDFFKAVPHTYLYEHLKSQHDEDITLLQKPKEILFSGRSNIGKSSMISTIFFDTASTRVGKNPGTTKSLNYYRIGKQDKRYVVDSPGYGYLGMKKTSGEKLIKMILKYNRESSRLCKSFLLIDLEQGVHDLDAEYLDKCKQQKIGIEVVFSRIDNVKPSDWMNRALALSYQLRPYHEILSPNMHLTSTKLGFGLDSVRASIMQSYLEAPTRKIVRRNGELYYMLEDKTSTPTDAEQKKYRSVIYHEKALYLKDKSANKSSDRRQLEKSITESNQNT